MKGFKFKLNQKVLPLCGLLVSSGPHASVSLQREAAIRVDIVGFIEQERQCYIGQSVKRNSHKIREFTQYLYNHPTIDNLCFAPLNMSILLFFFYQLGIPLPKCSTELYSHFICQAISRHLAKSGHTLENTITNLATLPEPYNKIIKQLGKLSFEALNKNKLLHLKTLKQHSQAWLAQSVQYFGLTGKTVTVNFLHLTVQEYPAYSIITGLQGNNKSFVFFMENSGMISFKHVYHYVVLTKDQKPSFKKFSSGGDDEIAISSAFLCDQLMMQIH